MDVSHRALEIADERLAPGAAAERSGQRVKLLHGLADLPRRPAGRLRRGGGRRGDRAPRPAAAGRLRAGAVRVRPAADGGADDAERRVQRAVREPARRQVPPPRPPLRVDAGRVPDVGRDASAERFGYTVALRCRSGRRTRASGAPTQMAVFAFPDGVTLDDHHASPSCRLVVLVGAVRLRQVHVRAQALQADRGALVRLLPRPGLRRRERPVRHAGRLRGAALRRRPSGSRGGRLTVIDATNVQADAAQAAGRAGPAVPRACRSPSCSTCPRSCASERNAGRARPALRPRTSSAATPTQLRRSLRTLQRRGLPARLRPAHPEEVDAASDRARAAAGATAATSTGRSTSSATCTAASTSCVTLLALLGYAVADATDRRAGAVDVAPPAGARRSSSATWSTAARTRPGVLRLVMGMVAAGTRSACRGNHDDKLLRKLRGNNVKSPRPGRDAGAARRPSRRSSASGRRASSTGCRRHYVLDDGRLVVAHAGLQGGPAGPRARRGCASFALYGETTGETDEFGLPVRLNWAADYRGRAMVVYGHTPVPSPSGSTARSTSTPAASSAAS